MGMGWPHMADVQGTCLRCAIPRVAYTASINPHLGTTSRIGWDSAMTRWQDVSTVGTCLES